MSLTELDIYHICHGTYEPNYPWDFLFQGEEDGGTYVGVRRIGGLDVVAFRGSTTPLDWLRNYTAFQTYQKGLGWGALGFRLGLDRVMANVSPKLQDRYIVTGHSRGAAEGTDFIAEMKLAGRPPVAGVLLAPPRTGRSELANLLADVPIRAYRNKGDPVLMVPPYDDHPYPLIDIDEEPEPNDPWLAVAPHHSELYGRAIAKLDPMPVYD